MRGTLAVTGDPGADGFVNRDPLALLVGMLLDQQVPMEWAFRGPATLRDRLGHLDAARIAAMPTEELQAAAATKPAIHRFPSSMATRVQDLCRHVTEELGGEPTRLWADGDGAEVRRRLAALPGYGDEKSMILLAVLAKRFGVRPAGWEEAAGPFADAQPRSVADIDGPDALARVRAWKREAKSAGRTKQQ
jgi:uncharacterized HhH-GPD family protein